jgi:hypothetical protein
VRTIGAANQYAVGLEGSEHLLIRLGGVALSLSEDRVPLRGHLEATRVGIDESNDMTAMVALRVKTGYEQVEGAATHATHSVAPPGLTHRTRPPAAQNITTRDAKSGTAFERSPRAGADPQPPRRLVARGEFATNVRKVKRLVKAQVKRGSLAAQAARNRVSSR